MFEGVKQFFKVSNQEAQTQLNSPFQVIDNCYWVNVRRNQTRTMTNNLASGNLPIDSDIIPGTGRSLLHQSIVFNKLEMFTLALLYNADVNLKSKEGTTPIHLACSLNRQQMIELLLEKGAKLDVVDQDGFTPYQRAEYYGHDKICEFLQDHINQT